MATLPVSTLTPPLSGERFTVVYRIVGTPAEARARAGDLCVEQTVEFPPDLLPAGPIAESVVGRIDSLDPVADGACEARISYAVETVAAAGDDADLPQLLNVLFGNSSLKPGLRIERLDLSPSLLRSFKGPRFGPEGVRRLVGAERRPLLGTALKPMGLTAAELAELAYRFALGGMDLIKDDHGLADQPFAPFPDRVARCADAVARANRETGGQCLYLPNVSGPAHRVGDRAREAKTRGAGGLLVSPGLVGWDTLRRLAEDDDLALPVMAHPAFLGSFVTSPDSGLSHGVLFGQLARLAGADASVYPNWGGRFSFGRNDCRAIADAARVPMGHVRPLLPTPGGGMSVDRIPEMAAVYGPDVVFLIGGALYARGSDLTDNARQFRAMADRWTEAGA